LALALYIPHGSFIPELKIPNLELHCVDYAAKVDAA